MSYKLAGLVALLGLNVLLLTGLVAGLNQVTTSTANVRSSFLGATTVSAITYTDILSDANQPTGFGGGSWAGPADMLTPAEQHAIQAAIDANIQLLALQGKLSLRPGAAGPLHWPLKPSGWLADNGYHGIANLVDHNPTYGQVLDYQCGNRTYDVPGYNHQGTDFFLWPFPWRRMAEGAVAAVAAAPGVIVYKQDGNPDQSCGFNNNPWNAVFVRHGDGSVTWYGHLKRGSLTPKPLGSPVTTGEYLGLIGSSGNSTGPHLHFELRSAANQLLDPYQGSCNLLNPDSWWVTQEPYYDSAVNKLTTGYAAPSFPACPAPESPNIQDSFSPGNVVYFTTYYRDQLAGQVSHYTIYRPNGTIYQQWSHQIDVPHYAASWWWWSFALPANAPTGTWRFTVQFNGLTYNTFFNVGVPTSITVLAPSTDDQWVRGTTQAILWADNLGGPVRLELWRDGFFADVIATSTPSDGRYDWNIPAGIPTSSAYQVRLVNLANEAVYDDSPHFAIVEAADLRQVQVASPNGGELWSAGDVVTITWTANFTGPINLALERAGQPVVPITMTNASSSVYTWTVPLNLPGDTQYAIRVTDASHSQVTDTSDSAFTIWNTADDPLWLLRPNGGDYWEIGATETIRWLTVFTDSVRLELRRSITETTALTATTSSSYDWTIPLTATLAADYRIRVVWTADETVYDESDTPFTIWDPVKVYLPVIQKPVEDITPNLRGRSQNPR